MLSICELKNAQSFGERRIGRPAKAGVFHSFRRRLLSKFAPRAALAAHQRRPFRPENIRPGRYLLLRVLAALVCLGVLSLSQTSAAPEPDQPDKPNLSGIWILDLEASTSLDPLMTQIGAGFLDRKYAALIKLKATLDQTADVLTIAARGPGFALDQTLYLDGRTDTGNLNLLGATVLKTRTAWSKDRKRLVATHQIKTGQGKQGQLIITRYLINEGKNLVVVYTLKLDAEPETSAHQIWDKQA